LYLKKEMSHIRAVFKTLKRKGRRALIPFITAGDPDLETTKQLIFSIEKSGGDILELGVPFSDPLADGPTIGIFPACLKKWDKS